MVRIEALRLRRKEVEAKGSLGLARVTIRVRDP